MNVAIADIDAPRVAAAASGLASPAGRVLPLALDVRDRGAWEAAADRAQEAARDPVEMDQVAAWIDRALSPQVAPNRNEYRVETQQFAATTDADGQLVLDDARQSHLYQWLMTARKPKAGKMIGLSLLGGEEWGPSTLTPADYWLSFVSNQSAYGNWAVYSSPLVVACANGGDEAGQLVATTIIGRAQHVRFATELGRTS